MTVRVGTWVAWCCAGFLWGAGMAGDRGGLPALSAAEPIGVELTAAQQGFDGETCWVHARAGAPGNAGRSPLVVMTMQKLLLSGSDVFYALNSLRSEDAGATWTRPLEQRPFVRQTMPADPAVPLPTGAEIAPQLLQPGDETTVCDFTPKWHAATGRLLGTGQTVWYRGNKVLPVRPRGVAYAVCDTPRHEWNPWKVLALPGRAAVSERGGGLRAAMRPSAIFGRTDPEADPPKQTQKTGRSNSSTIRRNSTPPSLEANGGSLRSNPSHPAAQLLSDGAQ